MEASTFVVEQTERSIPKAFCEKIVASGFQDFHQSAIENVCNNLKQLLGVDLMKSRSFRKAYTKSPRPHLFVNPQMSTAILLGEPQESRCVKGKAFEVTCFSKSKDSNIESVTLLKNLLLKELSLPEKNVHDGGFDENCNRNFIKELSETHRSNLVKRVEAETLNAFADNETRKTLRRMTTFPIKTYSNEMLGAEPFTFVSLGIFEERYSPICIKCGGYSAGTFLFDSKNEVSKVLESKSLICPNCGDKLDDGNASIQSFYQFTDLGLECSKGLWLEAYVKSVLEKSGIHDDLAKVCSVRGRDEFDVVFSAGDSLFLCECKDRIIGQNDLYVLATKVSRINEDEDSSAVVDKVLLVSTEPIPKDILTIPQAKEEVEYIPATGNTEEIRKKIAGAIKRARRKRRSKRLRELSNILLWFVPSTIEEAYFRRVFERDLLLSETV